MFERFESARDIYGYRLGAALTMEHDWLAYLPVLLESAESEDVEDFFEFRAAQTRQQIRDLNAVFEMLGYAAAEYPSPLSAAVTKAESAFIARCADELRQAAAIAAVVNIAAVGVATYVVLVGTLPEDAHPMAREILENILLRERRASDDAITLLVDRASGTRSDHHPLGEGEAS